MIEIIYTTSLRFYCVENATQTTVLSLCVCVYVWITFILFTLFFENVMCV